MTLAEAVAWTVVGATVMLVLWHRHRRAQRRQGLAAFWLEFGRKRGWPHGERRP